jgi:polyribonucleotide nucleotidyltransferase
MERVVVETEFFGRTLSLETGRIARQADGSVVIRLGDTMVLATAVTAPNMRPGVDFFPLTCDYQEKTYSAGKIPGGFFKREGRPSEKEILTSRLIDRPLRPRFPKGFANEVQIIASLLSMDDENDGDVLGITAASAALHISSIPFVGPIAAVRVGYIDEQFVINPAIPQMEKSQIDLVVAGSENALVMVEGEAQFVREEIVTKALMFGQTAIKKLIALQNELRDKVGRPKLEFTPPELPADILERVKATASARIVETLKIKEKQKRYAAFAALRQAVFAELNEGRAADQLIDLGVAAKCFEQVETKIMRSMMLKDHQRIDGRGFAEVRPITIQTGLLPRTHGSALFTRGETQALVTITLGTSSDEQKIDGLLGETWRRFLLHYNFPPFSVGEVRPLRGPGRREIGHGNLARRALNSVLPPETDFPYTIRVVSDILESNGSSSMATVCGGSLALMDAGVQTVSPVAGVAMGLVKEGDDYAILTDIIGDEDHLGDMDFKVAGTFKGITAIQMDIKIGGITEQIYSQALEQAKEARLHILNVMKEALPKPRPDLSPYAPRITTIEIPVDKIRDVIGPGGKIIRGIIEETGVKIDIEDDGRVMIASTDEEASKKAVAIIRRLTAVPELDKFYMGKVVRIETYGAFVEIMPGTDGLLHISQLDNKRVNAVEDILQMGDEVLVKVIEIDKENGRIRLSRKAALGVKPEEVIDLAE